jgi:tRNA G37 N-methylase TrmD
MSWQYDWLMFICSRVGVDERIHEHLVNDEIIGDYGNRGG